MWGLVETLEKISHFVRKHDWEPWACEWAQVARQAVSDADLDEIDQLWMDIGAFVLEMQPVMAFKRLQNWKPNTVVAR